MQLNIDTVIPIKNHIRHDASFKHNNFASKPHFLFFLILAGLIVFSRGENLLSAELSLNTFSYHEDFEEKDPFEFWTSNGSYKVNYKGLDSTKSSSNAASFKLDITLETATYVYWKIPVKIPSAGELYFKGDIYVDTTSNAEIALGTNVSFSPCPHSGVNILERLDQPTGIWETQESDLISYGNKKAEDIVQKYCGGATEADVGAWTDKIGLYIFSSQGGRIVVYVDNIEIKGMIPELSAYTSYCDNLWQSYIDRVNTEISEITSQIAGINEESLSCSQGQIFIRDAKTDIEEIKTNVKKNGYPSPEEYYEVKDIEILTNYICNETDGQSMTVYPWKPITTRKILPHTYPVPASPDNILSIQGCRGEFEPAAFVIRAAKDISSIQVEASDLDGPNNQKIASGNIDIRLVKCWYQAGEETRYNTGEKVLVPELLLKDDELVSVDFSAKQNALRVTIDGKEQYIDISSPDAIIPDNAIIKDSDTLKPFNLSANTNKQVWLTLEIPEDCIAGDYEGKIFVKDSKSILSELLLKVKVFPFELQAPDLDYAIYYRGKLKADENEIVGINS